MATNCLKCGVNLTDENGYFRYVRKSDGVRCYDRHCKSCNKRRLHEWSMEHKEHRKEQNREYRENNIQKLNEYRDRYYSDPVHKERKRVRRQIGHKLQVLSLWNEALNFFGPCACCGESRREFLSIDHINGDGKEKRKKGEQTGWSLLNKFRLSGWPVELKKEYRILCHNCNQAYGQFGYCPHKGVPKIPEMPPDARRRWRQ